MKPNFKRLGPKYGKQMKEVSDVINKATLKDAVSLQKYKTILLSNYIIYLDDVELSPIETISYLRQKKLERICK